MEMRSSLIFIGCILIGSFTAQPQALESGSTAARSAVALSSGEPTIGLPESGGLLHPTVNVPAAHSGSTSSNANFQSPKHEPQSPQQRDYIIPTRERPSHQVFATDRWRNRVVHCLRWNGLFASSILRKVYGDASQAGGS